MGLYSRSHVRLICPPLAKLSIGHLKHFLIHSWPHAKKRPESTAASTVIRRAPTRQDRRVSMISFLLGLINSYQGHRQIVNPDAGDSHLAVHCAFPCPVASLSLSRPGKLPAKYRQEGHHEKNVNQRNSGRRVAHGNGRWPTTLRPQHRTSG